MSKTPTVISENSHESIVSDQPKPMIYVHISGAVRRPGLYKLPSGSRMADAIHIAGSFSYNARSDQINLAEMINDGQKVVIPATRNENFETNGTVSVGGLININTANLQELDSLTGIGKTLAQRIIEHRELYGQFNDVVEVKKVEGITKKRFEKIKDKITI